jgi:hypothetical protein
LAILRGFFFFSRISAYELQNKIYDQANKIQIIILFSIRPCEYECDDD